MIPRKSTINNKLKSRQNPWNICVKKFIFIKLAGLQAYSQQLYYQMNFTGIFQQHLKTPHAPPCIDLSHVLNTCGKPWQHLFTFLQTWCQQYKWNSHVFFHVLHKVLYCKNRKMRFLWHCDNTKKYHNLQLWLTLIQILGNHWAFCLSSGNVGKYEFLAGKDILPEKDLLEKLLQSKYLNIHYYVVSRKSKLVLQKNNTKNQTRFVDMIDRKVVIWKREFKSGL